MATKIETSLFSWNNPQQLPRLQTLARVLEILPYQALVEALCERRFYRIKRWLRPCVKNAAAAETISRSKRCFVW